MHQGRPMGPQNQQGPQGMPRFPNQNQWNPRQNGPRPMPNGPPGPPQRPMVNIISFIYKKKTFLHFEIDDRYKADSTNAVGQSVVVF